MTYTKKLKDILELSGYNCTELAEELGCAPSTLTRIANGETERPSGMLSTVLDQWHEELSGE